LLELENNRLSWKKASPWLIKLIKKVNLNILQDISKEELENPEDIFRKYSFNEAKAIYNNYMTTTDGRKTYCEWLHDVTTIYD
jgi:hypothetical protein